MRGNAWTDFNLITFSPAVMSLQGFEDLREDNRKLDYDEDGADVI